MAATKIQTGGIFPSDDRWVGRYALKWHPGWIKIVTIFTFLELRFKYFLFKIQPQLSLRSEEVTVSALHQYNLCWPLHYIHFFVFQNLHFLSKEGVKIFLFRDYVCVNEIIAWWTLARRLVTRKSQSQLFALLTDIITWFGTITLDKLSPIHILRSGPRQYNWRSGYLCTCLMS